MDKYRKLKKIGEGSYGIVYKCCNKETGQIVAIKKFIESDDNPATKKIALREIRILKNLKHPNLITLIKVFKRNRKLHLVFEYCERTVLNELEKYPNGCPKIFIKQTIYQLLQAVQYCHAFNCIHRDIKPENILLTKNDVVKLADFGFARMINTYDFYTDYVGTRWYRSPGAVRYGPPVDVWAVGCVFAEMITGEALWPGRSDIEQLYLIRKTMGEFQSRRKVLHRSNFFIHSLSTPKSNIYENLTKRLNTSPIIIDFLYKCLDINPEKRWTCSELLQHDYFNGYVFHIPSSFKLTAKHLTTNYLPYLVNNPFNEQQLTNDRFNIIAQHSANEGWFRYLDPYLLSSERCIDCIPSWSLDARPIRFFIFDSSSGKDIITNQRITDKQFDKLIQDTSDKPTWFLTHKPLWRSLKKEFLTLKSYGNLIQIEAFGDKFPSDITTVISGHTHSYNPDIILMDNVPDQIIVGNGDALLTHAQDQEPF
ncbi:Cyclin-dependent kinase-like [Dirofilaria immitis]